MLKKPTLVQEYILSKLPYDAKQIHVPLGDLIGRQLRLFLDQSLPLNLEIYVIV